jgi:hypothetical protein
MSFVNTVDIIGDEALTHSILNGSITEIADNRVTSVGDSAFRGCSALIKADFPSVTSIYNTAFHDCSSLVTLALRSETMCVLYYTNSFDGSPIVNGTGYIYVPSALYDSYRADTKWSTYANQFRKLEDYTVDGTINGVLDTNRHMVRFFNGDTLLGYVMVSHGGSATYTGDEPTKEGEWAFKGWSPTPTNVTADMDCYAQFKSTKSYTRAVVDRSVTEIYSENAEKIGIRAFYFVSTLKSVDAPSASIIEQFAFGSCSGLASVNLPNAVTVQTYAFHACSALTSIDLPNATSIGVHAFNSCQALNTLILRSNTLCSLGNTAAIGGTKIASKTGYIYVPSALVNEYQSATNWSTYSTQFRAIEDYPDVCGGDN